MENVKGIVEAVEDVFSKNKMFALGVKVGTYRAAMNVKYEGKTDTPSLAYIKALADKEDSLAHSCTSAERTGFHLRRVKAYKDLAMALYEVVL